ncbi:MAG: ABC transporter substrate-binding protein, partial [Candidatus Thorarchaeota archaeon]|nr:ABC transporter substrate-binding protein [Candidatus Thorarchaeota archaeon]
PQHIGNFTEWRDSSNAIEVQDNYTVLILLEEPYTPFPALLATTAASMVSPTYVQSHGGITLGYTTSMLWLQSCGTGPYQVDEVVADDYIKLTKFEDYWNEYEIRSEYPYAGAIDKVTIKTVEFGSTRISNLNNSLSDACEWPKDEAGIVYAGLATDPSGDGTIKSLNPSLKVWADEPTYNVNGMIFNCREFYSPQENPLQNPFFLLGFRNAAKLSFNTSVYIEQALYGFGIQARGAIPLGMSGHNEDGTPYDIDINSAVESWNNAMDNGLDSILANNSYEITFLYNSGRTGREKACEILRDGIELVMANPSALQPSSPLTIQIQTIEWGTPSPYESRLNGFLNLESDFADPSDYATYLFRNDGIIERFGGVSSISNWNASYIDELLSEADQSTNPEERENLYVQIHDYAAERNPCMWLAQETNFQVMSFDVNGYTFNPNTKPYFYVYWIGPLLYYSIIPNPFCIVAGVSGVVSFVGIIVLTYMIEREKKAQFIAKREQAG